MTKKYELYYKDGNYILQYSNPNDPNDPFAINEDNMQFDVKKFYIYIFKDVNESIKIEIVNNISQNAEDLSIIKKGERIYNVIKELCEEITNKLNEECFIDLNQDKPY